jgi:hypothetical protein
LGLVRAYGIFDIKEVTKLRQSCALWIGCDQERILEKEFIGMIVEEIGVFVIAIVIVIG